MIRDEIDREILSLLVADARRSFADIGEHVGLSPAAVKRRVDRLEDDGVIRGYAAVVDRGVDGKTMETFVELYCGGRTAPSDIRSIVESFEQVVEAYTVSGEADALLLIRTADIAELEDTLERIRAHKSVDRTKSVIVLSHLLGRG
jgi:DNA-binding Lrp family transcriptional regulator